MPKDFSRANRVAEMLKRELSELISRELKDPRIGWLTVTYVQVSRDSAYADVSISCMGQDDPAEAVEVLKERAGFLRSRLGKSMSMRKVPELRFQVDETLERAERMNKLIADANRKPSNNDTDSDTDEDND